jgi:hypothetical protein
LRLAIDVCVSTAVELELWRAGYKIPVRAAAGEPDPDWLSRALNAGCQVVITMDRGAAAHATRAGMVSVLIPMFTTAHDMPGTVFDAMEEVEERIRAAERPARILAPIAALGLLLAACSPEQPLPKVRTPPRDVSHVSSGLALSAGPPAPEPSQAEIEAMPIPRMTFAWDRLRRCVPGISATAPKKSFAGSHVIEWPIGIGCDP